MGDTSERYIRMSDCPEIQERKPERVYPIHQVFYGSGEYRYWTDENYNLWAVKEDYTWLPQIGQSFDMVLTYWGYSPDIRNRYVVLLDEFQEWVLNNALYTSRQLSSMEQLAEAFYMHEVHGKVWDGQVWEAEEIPMRPLSLMQWLMYRIGNYHVQYPVRCGLCGTKTKGNMLVGFQMGCDCSHSTEHD